MREREREIFEELLKEISVLSRHGSLTAFTASRGSSYAGEFMIIGRAVNGNEEFDFAPEELSDSTKRSEYLNRLFMEDSSRLAWISLWWGRKRNEGYSPSRSAFFRVMRSVASKLGVIDITHPDWAQQLVYSNLYKVAPTRTGNPTAKLISLQKAKCIDILKEEIINWKPKRILFLTGMDWARDFLNGIGTLAISGNQDETFSGKLCIDSMTIDVVVAPHPMTKAEKPIVSGIVSGFSSLAANIT